MAARMLLAALVVCAAAEAAGQSHEAAPVPARPVPVVSRITLPPKPAAVPAADTEADAHAEPVQPVKKGYVPTGAPRRSASGDHADAGHGTAGKPKPIVSGAAHPLTSTPAAGSGQPAESAHDAAAIVEAALPTEVPAPQGDDHGPAVAAADRKPVKLSVVHGRIAAALAEARKAGGEAGPAAGEPAVHAAAPQHRTGGEAAPPARMSLTWPEPRWSVTWPDPGRLVISWPAFAAPRPGSRSDPK